MVDHFPGNVVESSLGVEQVLLTYEDVIPQDLLQCHLLGEEREQQGRFVLRVDFLDPHEGVVEEGSLDGSEVIDCEV